MAEAQPGRWWGQLLRASVASKAQSRSEEASAQTSPPTLVLEPCLSSSRRWWLRARRRRSDGRFKWDRTLTAILIRNDRSQVLSSFSSSFSSGLLFCPVPMQPPASSVPSVSRRRNRRQFATTNMTKISFRTSLWRWKLSGTSRRIWRSFWTIWKMALDADCSRCKSARDISRWRTKKSWWVTLIYLS